MEVKSSSTVRNVLKNYGPAGLGRAVIDVCSRDLKPSIVRLANLADRLKYGPALVLGPTGLTIPRVDPKTLVNKDLMTTIVDPPKPADPLGAATGGRMASSTGTSRKPGLLVRAIKGLLVGQTGGKTLAKLAGLGAFALGGLFWGVSGPAGLVAATLICAPIGSGLFYLGRSKGAKPAEQAQAAKTVFTATKVSGEMSGKTKAALTVGYAGFFLAGFFTSTLWLGILATGIAHFALRKTAANKLTAERKAEQQRAEAAKAAAAAKAARPLNEKIGHDDWPEVTSLTKDLLDALDAGSAAALPSDKVVLKRTNLAVEERLLQLEELEQPGKALEPEQSQARENLTALRTIIAEKLG